TAVALRTLPRQAWNDLPFPVAGAAFVGGITKDAPDRAAVPCHPNTRRQNALFNEPPSRLADAQTLAGDPKKDVLNDFCCGQAHLVTRVAACNSLGNIAISIGRVRHHADATAPSCVQLAASRAFQDFGALVFRDDALHLEEQIVFGAFA